MNGVMEWRSDGRKAILKYAIISFPKFQIIGSNKIQLGFRPRAFAWGSLAPGERVGVRGDFLRVKLVSISGTNGSGKTTLTRKLISRLWKEGKRSAVIVNEDGAVDFEPEFVQANNLWVTYLRGG